MAGILLTPCTIKRANEFVKNLHRHSRPVVGALFAVGLSDANTTELVGVAIVGRPVARGLNDGYTTEVTRLCTDGTPNACSALYGACRRAAKALGYRRIVTYTRLTESGASLRGAGWHQAAIVPARSWDTASRPRPNAPDPAIKIRWESAL